MPRDPAQDDPLSAAMDALRDTIIAGERYRQAVADRLGVSRSETAAVAFLHARGPLGQTELARGLSITPSAATALIDRLEADALAERVSHPLDRRRSTVRLTEHGVQLFAESRTWFEHAFDHIDRADLAGAAALLAVIAADLHAQVDQLGP